MHYPCRRLPIPSRWVIPRNSISNWVFLTMGSKFHFKLLLCQNVGKKCITDRHVFAPKQTLAYFEQLKNSVEGWKICGQALLGGNARFVGFSTAETQAALMITKRYSIPHKITAQIMFNHYSLMSLPLFGIMLVKQLYH